MTERSGSDEPPETLLVVETDMGFVVQRILTPRRAVGASAGPAAEASTKRLAVKWGLHDFLFHGPHISKGRGRSREVGDVLVVVGDVGLVLQVKSRGAAVASRVKEANWCTKQIPIAVSQATGTLRKLGSNERMQLENMRGRRIEIPVCDISWLSVVILDHPGVSDFVPDASCPVLLLRDWRFLFDQLKSTRAVVDYLRRIAELPPIHLGDEPARYHQLAAADASAAPGPLPGGHMVPGAQHVSLPLLSHEPANGDDEGTYWVLRQICEDIAVSGGFGRDVDEADRLTVLAAIDSLPVGYRSSLGSILLDRLDAARRAGPDESMWHFKCVSGIGPQLLFGVVAITEPKLLAAKLASYVSLRHEQLREADPLFGESLSVAIALSPSDDRQPPWDATLTATRGAQSFGQGEREACEELWGQRGASTA